MVKKSKILVVIFGLLLLVFLIRLFFILIPGMVNAPVDNQVGIENYNQEKIIEEYGKDIDSGLFLFPNQTSVMDEVLGVQYDIESYSLPAYVA